MKKLEKMKKINKGAFVVLAGIYWIGLFWGLSIISIRMKMETLSLAYLAVGSIPLWLLGVLMVGVLAVSVEEFVMWTIKELGKYDWKRWENENEEIHGRTGEKTTPQRI